MNLLLTTSDNVDNKWIDRRPCSLVPLALCDDVQPNEMLLMILKYLLQNHILAILLPSSSDKPSQFPTWVVMTCPKVGRSMRKATSNWTPRTTTTTGKFVLDASSDIIYNHDIELMTSPRPKTAPSS